MKPRFHGMVVLGALALVFQPDAIAEGEAWSDIPAAPVWAHTPSEYSILVYRAATPFDAAAMLRREQPPPTLSAADIDGTAADYVADPFLFPHRDQWYLFYELLPASPRQGCIAWAESPDGGRTWSQRGVAIDEPFHLSYPHVFGDGDEVYMVAEANEANQIRIYKAESFPGRWSLLSVPANGRFVDSTMFRHDGKWWLFTSSYDSSELHLYMSEHLDRGWTAHPLSPVVRGDVQRSRPAGRVFRHDGRLWRMAMDCAPRYGWAVRLMEIETLTPTAYRQRDARATPLIEGGLVPWAGLGMHHYDPWPLNADASEWMIAIDGNTAAQPETPLAVQFGNGGLLLGATRRPARVHPGGKLLLRLYWKLLPFEDIAINVHFRRDGETLFDGNHLQDGRRENYQLFVDVPAGTVPGDVSVWLGTVRPGQGPHAVRSPYPQAEHMIELPLRFEVLPPVKSSP